MTTSCQSQSGGTLKFYLAARGTLFNTLSQAQTKATAVRDCSKLADLGVEFTKANSGAYWVDPNGGDTSDAFLGMSL